MKEQVGSSRGEIDERLVDILQCPDCASDVTYANKRLVCEGCKRDFLIHDGIPLMLPSNLSSEMQSTIKSWNKNYLDWTQEGLSNLRVDFYSYYIDDILGYVDLTRVLKEGETFLEIGCGPSWIGMEIAKRGFHVIALDCCIEALKLAKRIYAQNGVTALFVCGDVLKTPFKKDLFHLTYGGGVIEHFDDTQQATDEMFRITARGGNVLNSVPYLSISSLTYRQRWGNIPDFPVLKQLAEFVHIHLLKRKHMMFGYEKSFTMKKLRKIFNRSGFSKIEIGQYKCYLPINFIKNESIRALARKLASSVQLFWPMVYIISYKD